MIEVDRIDTDERGYRLEVQVREETGSTSRHEVSLSRSDHERLTGSNEGPEAFVRRCFDFLLERESKEQIMSEFDVSVISTYFPEFEKEIKA